MTSAQVVLALVGSGGLGAVLASIIQSWVNRRNLDASTTKLITDAASGVVTMSRTPDS